MDCDRAVWRWEGGEREEGGKEGEREEGEEEGGKEGGREEGEEEGGKEGEREEGEEEGGRGRGWEARGEEGRGRRERRGSKGRRGRGREEGGERVQQMNSWHRLTKAKQYLYVFTISSRNTRVFERRKYGHMTVT